MRILAKFQAMADSEILSFIPPSELDRVKLHDPKPVFRAYVVGHEGESEGRIVGIGKVIKKWFKTAIQTLYDKIQYGTPIFHQHGETNDQAGRPPIGEVVGKAMKYIGERLSAIAVTYIKPEFRAIPLDVASIEADFSWTPEDDIEVQNLTGIALGNSAVNRPGFAGATLLAQIQAFSENKDRHKGGENMTLEEIVKAIQEGSFKPSDLFSPKVLAKDPTIEELVEEKVSGQMRARGYNIRKAAELEDDRKKWDEEKKALGDQVVKLNRELAKGRVGELFEKAKAARKLDDLQAKFIKDRLARFEPQDPEKIEAEFNGHVDKEIDEYNQTAELFGIKKDAGTGGNGKGDQKVDGGTAGAGAEQHDTGEIDEKFLSPETNPFIPKN